MSEDTSITSPSVLALIYGLFASMILLLIAVLILMVLVCRLTKTLRNAKISTAHTNPVFELDKDAANSLSREAYGHNRRSICSLPPWEQGSSESVEIVPSRKTSKNVKEGSPSTRRSVVDPPQANSRGTIWHIDENPNMEEL